MSQVSLRHRLPRDIMLPWPFIFGWHSILMTKEFGLGWDAHAYYVAWQGDLYDVPPGTQDAYNYSPLFAQLVWPLTHLPWPVFCALFIGASALAIAWLVLPLSKPNAVLVWIFCLPEILSGNVFWLLALCTVAGFTRGGPWCSAAFTKIVPCLGPLWFLLRGEWRRLGGFVGTAAVLLGVSLVLDPALWRQWFDFLVENSGTSPSMALTPPFAIRLPVGLALLVFAARTDRRWLVPVCMVIVSPVVGEGTFALLAAIPRLLQPKASDAGPGAPEPPVARDTSSSTDDRARSLAP